MVFVFSQPWLCLPALPPYCQLRLMTPSGLRGQPSTGQTRAWWVPQAFRTKKVQTKDVVPKYSQINIHQNEHYFVFLLFLEVRGQEQKQTKCCCRFSSDKQRVHLPPPTPPPRVRFCWGSIHISASGRQLLQIFNIVLKLREVSSEWTITNQIVHAWWAGLVIS